jgi:hypothetical protein
VRAVKRSVNFGPGSGQDAGHPLVYVLEVSFSHHPFGDAALIGNDDHGETRAV